MHLTSGTAGPPRAAPAGSEPFIWGLPRAESSRVVLATALSGSCERGEGEGCRRSPRFPRPQRAQAGLSAPRYLGLHQSGVSDPSPPQPTLHSPLGEGASPGLQVLLATTGQDARIFPPIPPDGRWIPWGRLRGLPGVGTLQASPLSLCPGEATSPCPDGPLVSSVPSPVSLPGPHFVPRGTCLLVEPADQIGTRVTAAVGVTDNNLSLHSPQPTLGSLGREGRVPDPCQGLILSGFRSET